MHYIDMSTVFLLLLMAAGHIWAQQAPRPLPIRPDKKLTPGAIATLDVEKVCHVGYSKTVRKTSEAMKARVYARYGIVNEKGADFEIDHRVALSIGGADVEKNEWPQSYLTQPWNAYRKDVLEHYIWRRVCIQKTMTLLEGQRIFQGDWIDAYHQYIK
jgi:hypothetical protein